MAKLISNKVKKVSSDQADPNRYEFLSLENAEPDLGVPAGNGYFLVSNDDGTRDWTTTIEASTLQVDTAAVNSISVGVTSQQTNTVTTTSTSATTISQWSINEYSSSKAVITAVSNNERQVSELLISHNSSNAFATEYGVLTTNGTLFTVDCDLVGNDMVIEVTSSSTDTTDYKIHETLFEV